MAIAMAPLVKVQMVPHFLLLRFLMLPLLLDLIMVLVMLRELSTN